jgi:hypothetical protein
MPNENFELNHHIEMAYKSKAMYFLKQKNKTKALEIQKRGRSFLTNKDYFEYNIE